MVVRSSARAERIRAVTHGGTSETNRGKHQRRSVRANVLTHRNEQCGAVEWLLNQPLCPSLDGVGVLRVSAERDDRKVDVCPLQFGEYLPAIDVEQYQVEYLIVGEPQR